MWFIFNWLVTALVLCVPIVFCYDSVDNSESNDELVFVHIMYRHGDRNIVSAYPNDPWKDEKYWPEGFGQLTKIGKQQQYELGMYLRRRYFSLIANNGSYSQKNVYVRSTDVDRTLMSAASNLAGMFPPMNEQIWNKSLLWQAIPIHTIPEKFDNVLAMKRPCPLYMRDYKEYVQSDEVQSIFKDNRDLIQYLKITGKTFQTVFDFKEFYETLSIERLRNYTLPNWAHSLIGDGSVLGQIARFSYLMDTKTKLMARLKTGFLIREILDRFTQKIESKLQPDRALWIYSAHDGTIVNVLNALGLFKSQPMPDFAACLFFELHKQNGSFYVEIIYKPDRRDDTVSLTPLVIPNCGQKCPLSRMFEIYKDIIPTKDFETECRLTSDNNSSGPSKYHLSLVWPIIGLTTLLILN